MSCSICKQRPMCVFYDFQLKYTHLVDIELIQCKNFTSDNNSDINVIKLTDSPFENKESSNKYSLDIANELEKIFTSQENEKPKKDIEENTSKLVICDKCGESCHETDITETLNHRKLCPKCYDADPPLTLL